jgi:hypothetical protein
VLSLLGRPTTGNGERSRSIVPFDQMFQFTHLCLDDPGIQSLKDDLVDAMELSKLWRDFLAENSKDYSDQTGRDLQQRTLRDIIAKAGVISDAFFTDVAYKFSEEEIAGMKPTVKNPVQQPPNRSLRRQLGRVAGSDLPQASPARRIKGRYVDGVWQGGDE